MRRARKQISTGSPMEQRMAYSRAVVQGDWCVISGVTGYDYRSMQMPDGVAAQAENCFATIAGVLEEAGFAWTDIIRVAYFVADRDHVEALAPVLSAHLDAVRPAATMVIAQLIHPDMLVEIEVSAYRG
ncbi:MAG: RidA family protein [Pseudomonadota bacterium]